MSKFLMRAVTSGRLERVTDALKKRGVDVNWKDEKATGTTPLIHAAYRGRTEIARELIAHGADVNLGNHRNYTPLMVAAREWRTETVDFLLDSGANINAQDDGGFHALMLAVEHGAPDTVQLLLERGADVNLPNASGFTPLMAAAWRGTNDRGDGIFEMLLAQGADVTATAPGTQARPGVKTALSLAKERGHDGIAARLQEANAKL